MKFNPHMLGYGALIAVLVFAGVAWLRAHDAWMRAAAIREAQDSVIKVNQDIITKAQQHSEQVTQRETQQVAAIQKQASSPATEAQVKTIIQALLPKAEVQTIQAPSGPLLAVPDTQENRDAIVKAQVDFQVCGVRLDACTQRAADFQIISAGQDRNYAAIAKERDAYKQAAQRGHGFWANLKHDLLVGGISFGLGYALHK